MRQSDPSFRTIPKEGLAAKTWEHFLKPGERVLWHGRPDSEALFSPTATKKFTVGIPIIAFGAVMVNITWPQHGNFQGMWPVWMIAGILILGGLAYSLSAPYRDRARRMRTWYTLTNKRAVIATDIKRKEFTSYPITKDNDIRLPLFGKKTTVWFAQEVIPASDHEDTDDITLIGFELIKDAPYVAELLEQVKEGKL